VPVTAAAPVGVAAHACDDLVAGAPGRVAGQAQRTVEPDPGFVAAWGDPPIVLTCGVPRPSAVPPWSLCFTGDGIEWLATRGGRAGDGNRPIRGALDFTTVGRSPYVTVRVPTPYQPAADALVDLAGTVKQHTLAVKPCH
jgi:hypothetical protein